MSMRSLLSSPSADPVQSESEDLGQQLLDLNRQITATIVAELATGSLSLELAAIIEHRDILSARLARREGTKNG